jgi:hypothetical protein
VTNNVKKQKAKAAPFSLTRTFNTFAKKAVQDFPQLKDRFIFYSVPTESFHGSPGVLRSAETLSNELQEEADSFEADGIHVTAFAGYDSGYHLMAFVREPEGRRMTSWADSHERDILNILEHELGHLVAPAADFDNQTSHNRNFCESIADAFSFIRQQQECEKFTASLKATIWIRTMSFVCIDATSPLTAPVLTELMRLARNHDLSKLTPAQSANLAYRLSLQYACSEQELQQLKKIFEPVRQAYKTDPHAALKKCAEIMFDDHGEHSQAVFAAGKAFLEPFLKQNMNVLTTVLTIKEAGDLKPEGKFWDDVRDKINAYESRQPKETPRQRLARKTGYLQALGHFDRQPDKTIDPQKYETTENQAYLQSARQNYITKTAAKRNPGPAC